MFTLSCSKTNRVLATFDSAEQLLAHAVRTVAWPPELPAATPGTTGCDAKPVQTPSGVRGGEWSADEFALCVEVYDQIHDRINRGEPVNKSRTAAELAEALGRTRCAVEYVWGNISYLRQKLGLDWMPGAAPRGHASAKLARLICGH